MFNVGGGELAVILLLALVFLGPERLPQAARQFGKFMAEYRRMAAGFKSELKDAMDLPDSTVSDLRSMVDTVRNPLDAITRPSTPTSVAPTPAAPTPAAPTPPAIPPLPVVADGDPPAAPGAEPTRRDEANERAVRPEVSGPEQSFS